MYRNKHLLPTLVLLSLTGATPVLAQNSAKSAPPVDVNTKQLTTVATFAAKSGDIIKTWYPKIADILGMPAPQNPNKINVRFDLNYDGVAETGGDEIRVSARYVAQHPDDTGMLVHELCHVLQAYPQSDAGWLVEGIADYVRFYYFEPEANRPHPNPAKANCRDAYRTTAAFLEWASRTYNPKLVKTLDASLKAGTYKDDLFEKATGKNLDTLNAEWLTSLKTSSTRTL